MNCYNSNYELAQSLLECARKNKLTIGCAESCTAGLLSATLARVAGASDVLVGAIVSYAVSVKRDLLGVADEILQGRGVYSFECAQAMARAARVQLSTSIGVGITGVAGPGPSEDGTSAGSVWIAVDMLNTQQARFYSFAGERDDVRLQACEAAIELMLEVIMNMGDESFYAH